LRVRSAILGWLTVLAICFFACYTVVEAFGWDGKTYRDFQCFWKAGTDVREGREAYAASMARNCPFYNPPTALPLFAAFSLFPTDLSYAAWTILCGLMILALIFACRKGLAAEKAAAVAGLDTVTVLTLTAALGMSNAARSNLINGQMGIVASFALVLAYWARGAMKPFFCAAALAVASVKINLMLPLVLLFLRPLDRKVLIWTPILVLGICLSTAGVGDQWNRAKTLAAGIEHSTHTGQVNDYSRAGPHPADMLGFDKLFYHFGVTDRSLVRILQLTALLVLGTVLLRLAWKGRTAPGLLASLLALFAVIFLYHRNYDTVVLGLPLAFATGHARIAKTPPRWWMTGAALCILSMMYLPRKALFLLMHRTFSSAVVSGVVEYAVLPAATWLVLCAMFCLWRGGTKLAESVIV
jgi:hypothetical protein